MGGQGGAQHAPFNREVPEFKVWGGGGKGQGFKCQLGGVVVVVVVVIRSSLKGSRAS